MDLASAYVKTKLTKEFEVNVSNTYDKTFVFLYKRLKINIFTNAHPEIKIVKILFDNS